MRDALLRSLPLRRGHFRLESGHHGDLWLDLDLWFVRAARTREFAAELARLLAPYWPEVVCGPLVGGALLAQMVAAELDAELCYSERLAQPSTDTSFAARYRVPGTLRQRLDGRRVAIVDDAVNAGSAVCATHDDLEACGAETVALAALLVLGPAATTLAAAWRVPLVAMASLPSSLWKPSDCPLCASGTPLEDGSGA